MAEKLRLDIQVLLPEIRDEADACVGRLISELEGKLGVEGVHLRPASDALPAQLCVHYDPQELPLARIRQIVEASGARISARFGHVLWDADCIGHERRARMVADALRAKAGVLEADASASGRVHIEFDREQISHEQLRELLEKIGVRPRISFFATSDSPTKKSDHVHQEGDGHKQHTASGDGGKHSHAHGGLLGANSELIFALACGALLITGYLIEKLVPNTPGWAPLACYVLAYGFGGFYTLREAIENLRMKRFEIDTLMLVAAAGAAALGAWAEGALLLFLFSLGHSLEHYAMGRAKRAIEALAELAPDTATVRQDGQITQIPVEQLEVGDVVIVRPNERMPADGFLVVGLSSVNQAPVTGESMPVDKRPVVDQALARAKPDMVDEASRIFAGTINGSGSIEVEVTRRSTDSALARVVRMVSEAETRKSPTQRFTDRFERIFVPSVLVLAVVMLFAWVVVDEPFRDSFYRAMAVLVAASPCALAIATPSAVLSGIARAARGGVLIKGGAPLEELGSLKAMAFDKTGTLTEGRPRITDIVPVNGTSETELLAVAVAVESLSDHPLAAAITRDGKARLENSVVPTASDMKSLTGRGVTATINGEMVWIGKAEMFGVGQIPALGEEVANAVEQLRQAGRTSMIVRLGSRDLGAIGLLDTPRAGARETWEL